MFYLADESDARDGGGSSGGGASSGSGVPVVAVAEFAFGDDRTRGGSDGSDGSDGSVAAAAATSSPLVVAAGVLGTWMVMARCDAWLGSVGGDGDGDDGSEPNPPVALQKKTSRRQIQCRKTTREKNKRI